MRKPALGKGLDAILGTPSVAADAPPETTSRRSEAPAEEIAGKPLMLPIEQLSAGRGQPRRRFDDAALEQLADSIRHCGILQPLVVRQSSSGYELIAGERRLRAAARAGLDKVPVVLRRDVSVGEDVELALIENVQREDLTPIEVARGYRRLVEQHGYSQEQVAARVGKSRAAVSNTLRLLALPEPLQAALDEGALNEGNARSLLGLSSAAAQIKLAQRVMREGLSVRQTEALVRSSGENGRQGGPPRAPRSDADPDRRALEDRLTRALGTRVRIRGQAAGRVEVRFSSTAELGRLAERLLG